MAIPNYSFQLRPVTFKGEVIPKCYQIIYDEPNYKLVIEFDGSGVPQFDLCADDAQFHKWTEPTGELISKENQKEIIRRLLHWARTEKRLRLDIGPGISREDFFAQQEKEGFKVERRPDGTVVVSHPQRKL